MNFKKILRQEFLYFQGIPLFLTKIAKKIFQKPLDKRKLYAIIKVQMKERNKKCSYLSKKRGNTDGIIRGSRHGTAGSRRDAAQEI